jgi:tryptophan halogenase
MQIKNLAIIGGGTAGLITALILKKDYPKLKIDLIKSDKIGIVGVGEGSTEHWAIFMQHCDIKLHDLLLETDATFKYGINFINWQGDNKNYIQNVSSNFNIESQTGSKFVYSYLIANGASEKGLTHNYIEKSLHRKPYWGINQFHFNTFKLNDFLLKLCNSRGIAIISEEISEINLLEDGRIGKIKTFRNELLDYDFYVDSTGFHRLFLEKTLKVKWLSYGRYLPMNSAIAFPTEKTDNIDSFTISRAMNAGWLWRIPTQNRHGNGYVFNDNFINFDQAQTEVERLYGSPIQVAKKIKFDAGMLEKSWVKNCVAIGLSSSFVEPLEASSIGTSIQQAFLLGRLLNSYIPSSTYCENIFNKNNKELVENIFDFIQLHYVTKRRDTDFWRSVEELIMTPGLEEKLDLYNYKMPSVSDFSNRQVLFKEANWILVMHGLGLIKKEIALKDLSEQPDHLLENLDHNIYSVINLPKDVVLVDHRTALQWLIDNPET